jgi:hypothetical protein
VKRVGPEFTEDPARDLLSEKIRSRIAPQNSRGVEIGIVNPNGLAPVALRCNTKTPGTARSSLRARPAAPVVSRDDFCIDIDAPIAGKRIGPPASADAVEDVIRRLKSKGVRFEHYDLPDTRREGDVHVSGHIKVAWFKDPDGNILSVVNR